MGDWGNPSLEDGSELEAFVEPKVEGSMVPWSPGLGGVW